MTDRANISSEEGKIQSKNVLVAGKNVQVNIDTDIEHNHTETLFCNSLISRHGVA
jgi:hypothetical protein